MPKFNPENVLLQDSPHGEIPKEQGTLIIKEIMVLLLPFLRSYNIHWRVTPQ